MADVSLGVTNTTAMFQILYDKKSLILFNTATPLLKKIVRDEKFLGKSRVLEAITSWGGGVGSGTLPETNVFEDQNATITRKRMYSRIEIDREAMKASKNGQGAFEDATKRRVRKGVEDFMRNMSRALFAIENGKIFECDNTTNVTGTAGVTYTLTGLASTWVPGFVEKKDKVQIGSEVTAPLEISSVNYVTRTVVLLGTSATLTAAIGAPSTAKVYMQGSKDNDIQSILQAVEATSGTLYGITVGPKWQSFQKSAASAALSTDLMNEVVSQVEFQSGESPDLIVTSYKQLRKLQNLLGDKVRFMVQEPRSPLFRKAQFNFSAIEFSTASGPIPVVADRMCPDDRMLFLNTDQICLYSAGPAQWADDDGTVFLRLAASDAYEARYALYGDVFISPTSQGVLYSLA
jgi:hypothetical protein